MSFPRFSALLLLAFAPAASAIVIRDDVPDARYRVAPEEFPALVDLPHEGHGVLIAPQWMATVAHVAQRSDAPAFVAIWSVNHVVRSHGAAAVPSNKRLFVLLPRALMREKT